MIIFIMSCYAARYERLIILYAAECYLLMLFASCDARYNIFAYMLPSLSLMMPIT